MDVKFVRARRSQLNKIDIVPGQVIALVDSSAWYYDTLENTRLCLSSSDVRESLPTEGTKDILYCIYGESEKGLYIWSSSQFVKLGEVPNIDSVLSLASENAVQNKVVTEALNTKIEQTDLDDALLNKLNKQNASATGTFSVNRDEYAEVGSYSVSTGYKSIATGQFSSTRGLKTTANSDYMDVAGKYNLTTENAMRVTGNGTSDSERADIEVLDLSGNLTVKGDVKGNNISLADTKSEVDTVSSDFASYKSEVSNTYLTKSDAASQYATITTVSGKQDKLTEGDNITITGAKISAKDTTYENATTTSPGLMSISDKVKLDSFSGFVTTIDSVDDLKYDGSICYVDGIAIGDIIYIPNTLVSEYARIPAGKYKLLNFYNEKYAALAYGSDVIVTDTSYWGSTDTYSDATHSEHGLMSAEDKTTLDMLSRRYIQVYSTDNLTFSDYFCYIKDLRKGAIVDVLADISVPVTSEGVTIPRGVYMLKSSYTTDDGIEGAGLCYGSTIILEDNAYWSKVAETDETLYHIWELNDASQLTTTLSTTVYLADSWDSPNYPVMKVGDILHITSSVGYTTPSGTINYSQGYYLLNSYYPGTAGVYTIPAISNAGSLLLGQPTYWTKLDSNKRRGVSVGQRFNSIGSSIKCTGSSQTTTAGVTQLVNLASTTTYKDPTLFTFDSSTHKLTIQTPGMYTCYGAIQFSSIHASGEKMRISIYTNGSASDSLLYSSAGTVDAMNISSTQWLNSGDVVHLEVGTAATAVIESAVLQVTRVG